MENSIYTVDYFIKKFEAIPEYKWTEGNFVDGDASCAQGHCGVRTHNKFDVWDLRGYNPEAEALITLFQGDQPIGHGIVIAGINNGYTEYPYKQPTPKQRVIAALYDIKAKQQPQPEVKQITVYKTVVIDSTVKELSGQLTNN